MANLYALGEAARRRRWVGHAVAVAGTALGLGLRLALGEWFQGFPFISFIPGVLAAACLGGLVPGVLAVLLSSLAVCYFLIEPVGSFTLGSVSAWMGLGSFVAVGGGLVGLADLAMRSGIRLGETSRALAAANARLEQTVAERMRELTLLNAELRAEMERRDGSEAQLRHLQKLEAVGQLTGGIAHDFNNMLAIVIGSLDAMRRRLAQGRTDIERHLDAAMEGARRTATLTHKLLAFSRNQPLAPAVVDANALVAGLEHLLRRTLGETIGLRCALADDLWRCRVDPGQLENALLNLVINARDAMPEGGRLTIETQNAWLDDAYAAEEPDLLAGQYVMIAVTDTGCGMTPEVAARAFDPFFTTKGEGRGTGLGLSQVHGFIKQSQGHVRIYSEPTHGTTVKAYLPRHRGEEASPPPPADRAEPPPRGQRELVLLVEDDPAVRRVHAGMLRELGYAVQEAADGPEALALLESAEGLRLLFTDVVMPGMNGRVVAERARMLRPGLPVLYTTGYAPNAILHNGVLDAGMALLTKPFTLDQLGRKLRQVLEEG
ncbi:ATP-binding protein [Belnapia rosea]|uniref:histidine kinase n=1 Tax=Belnapia rosea TaxID=938405 RepID=A0A1G6JFU5_9PROT|nr:ATP-binding protein [Belnapia rosea]SDC17305.1 His Kinase A (phospho-acceptor) domain-containing protein [Belnapia rosea]